MSRAAIPHARTRSFGLDLMRATAVLLVMVSHWANNIGIWYGYKASPKLFFAGDVGVDLFFALSGYLIGNILLEMIERGPSWAGLRTFLIRRWMRTLPLYWLWLAVLALLWPPVAGSHVVLRTGLLLQNFAWRMPPGFFFAVSWSLTIEEWFYLGFGTLLVGAALLLGRRAVWPVLLVFMAVPLILRLTIPAYPLWSNGLWHSVVFRLDAIAYGVAVAQASRRASATASHPMLLLLLGLLLIATVWADVSPVPDRLMPALLDIALVSGGAFCIPAALRLPPPRAWIRAIVTEISVQSYGLYLIHLTILVDLAQGLYFHHRIARWAAVIIAVVLPFGLSALSFRFMEGPLLAARPAQR